jgi:hypothetical protein
MLTGTNLFGSNYPSLWLESNCLSRCPNSLRYRFYSMLTTRSMRQREKRNEKHELSWLLKDSNKTFKVVFFRFALVQHELEE